MQVIEADCNSGQEVMLYEQYAVARSHADLRVRTRPTWYIHWSLTDVQTYVQLPAAELSTAKRCCSTGQELRCNRDAGRPARMRMLLSTAGKASRQWQQLKHANILLQRHVTFCVRRLKNVGEFHASFCLHNVVSSPPQMMRF